MMHFFRFMMLFLLLPASTLAEGLNSGRSSVKDRVIVATGNRPFAPVEFINDKGQPDGFSVELFRARIPLIQK